MSLRTRALPDRIPDPVRRWALRALFRATVDAFEAPMPDLRGRSADADPQHLRDMHGRARARPAAAARAPAARRAATSVQPGASGPPRATHARRPDRGGRARRRPSALPVDRDRPDRRRPRAGRRHPMLVRGALLPDVCRLMSASDAGLLAGLTGGGRTHVHRAHHDGFTRLPGDAHPRRGRSAMRTAIVVGSGAGGATVAKELQGEYDVTVLEAGRPYRRCELDRRSIDRLARSRLLVDPRLIRLAYPPMRVRRTDDMLVVHGSGTGGTTTVATGNGIRADDDLRALGIDLDEEFAQIASETPCRSSTGADGTRRPDACSPLPRTSGSPHSPHRRWETRAGVTTADAACWGVLTGSSGMPGDSSTSPSLTARACAPGCGSIGS